jgi:hypothetical protein
MRGADQAHKQQSYDNVAHELLSVLKVLKGKERGEEERRKRGEKREKKPRAPLIPPSPNLFLRFSLLFFCVALLSNHYHTLEPPNHAVSHTRVVSGISLCFRPGPRLGGGLSPFFSAAVFFYCCVSQSLC